MPNPGPRAGCDAVNTEPELKRSLSLSLLVLYGLGNILGAGIYVLIGKVAATAGFFSLVVFALVNLALIGIQRRLEAGYEGFSAPR
jgi:amino acid permease